MLRNVTGGGVTLSPISVVEQLGSCATHVALCNKIGPYFKYWCKVLAVKFVKDVRTIRRKDDKFVSGKDVITRHSEGNNNLIPKNLVTVDTEKLTVYPSKSSLTREDLCYGKVAHDNNFDSPETVYSLLTTHNSLKRAAFTLAEVLITLGIIGIVAAMTLPTLIQQHQKQVFATGAKKGLNTISNLINKIQAEEDASSYETTTLFTSGLCALDRVYDSNLGQMVNKNGCEDIYGNPSFIEQLISKNLKVVKTCKGDDCNIKYHFWASIDNNGKFQLSEYGNGYLNKSSNDIWSMITGLYTADGMIIYVFPSAGGLSFLYDTNGEKGPNTYGRDLFGVKYCMNDKGIRYSSYGSACVADDSYAKPTHVPLVHLMSNGWKMDY